VFFALEQRVLRRNEELTIAASGPQA